MTERLRSGPGVIRYMGNQSAVIPPLRARVGEALDGGAQRRDDGALVAHVPDHAGAASQALGHQRPLFRSRQIASASMRPEYQLRAAVSEREPGA